MEFYKEWELYAVKSGYRWHAKLNEVCTWTVYRKLLVPLKVKTFMKRLCRYILPTRLNLVHKQISVPIICPQADAAIFGGEWAGQSRVFLRCFVTKMHGVLFAKEAEVYGLREALSWVLIQGFSSVVFELDAKTIVDAFHYSKPNELEFVIGIQDCRILCQQGFQFFVCFTR